MEAESAFFNTSDYRIIESKKLGEGSYGIVYVAERIDDHQEVAAKVINIEHGFDGHEQMLFLRESFILKRLNHAAVIKFIGINFKSFSDENFLQPTIITEYLRHGSLKDNLNKERNSLSDSKWTPTKKYIILLGICNALQYLHEQGIAHRDLKPDNILLDDDYYPRICDFGLSKCCEKSLTKSIKLSISGNFGTPLYLAPEILRGDENYDQSVDVYAFAMIAYEIVTGVEPFSELGNDISTFKLINKIIGGYRPKFPPSVSDKMKELIKRCWSESPEKRPTFNEIFEMLSEDLTYFKEDVDKSEIQSYLNLLAEPREEHAKKSVTSMNDNKAIEKELTKLKTKVFELQREHDSLSKSNESLYQGLVSLLGDGKMHNSNKAIDELKISSSQGNRYSSFVAGLLYETGKEVGQNIKESLKYYEESSKQGNSNGFRRIGILYENGIGMKQDYSKAKEFYEKAADLGNASAFANLGVLYERGKGVRQNYKEAIRCYEKAAELGDAISLNYLGVLYEKGRGVKRNYSKAKEYFEQADELGIADASNKLGVLYDKGKGVKQDYTKAKKYYEKAAELGHAGALFNLGVLYYKGNGVKQDYQKAKEYYEKAAELDNTDALINLGVLYYNGTGVKLNYEKAKEYYEKAANLGNAVALTYLGVLYYNGNGVKQDYCKAKYYYEKAAELGNDAALTYLGVLYYNGNGVDQNYIRAIEYYEKAAESDNADALFNLGVLYENGTGVKQNYNEAKKYYEKAAKFGNKSATKYLELLKNRK